MIHYHRYRFRVRNLYVIESLFCIKTSNFFTEAGTGYKLQCHRPEQTLKPGSDSNQWSRKSFKNFPFTILTFFKNFEFMKHVNFVLFINWNVLPLALLLNNWLTSTLLLLYVHMYMPWLAGYTQLKKSSKHILTWTMYMYLYTESYITITYSAQPWIHTQSTQCIII